LAKSQGYDLLELIDELCNDGLLKKALLPTRSGKKLLALALPERAVFTKKAKNILKDFEEFVKTYKA
jgi:hypothetical protein